jgi:hypothetical protein
VIRVNWNFESGDFSGWKTRFSGIGAWHVYADGSTPPDPAVSDPNFPFNVPQPPEGKFAAVDSVAAQHVLARIFATAPGDRGKLAPRAITFDLSH